jgi:hypothetical protein
MIKVLKSCLLAVAVILAASGFSGCNQTNDTLFSVAVTPDNQSMAKGTTLQFTANGTFTNGMIVPWTQVVTWSSSNTAVATVNNTAGSNGIVTSLGYGTTIITAYDAANNLSGSATLTVTDPESIMIFPTNPFMAVGTGHQFSAIALFSGGTVTQVITTFASWQVSSPDVATITDTPGVDGNGNVTAGANPGTTVIQAVDPTSGATGKTTVTVTSTSIASIAVTPDSPIISLSTPTMQFSAIGTFQDGSTTETLNSSMTASWAWSSSNTGVATIDYYTGIVQAVAAGTANITATDPITGVSGFTTLTLQ